MIFLERDERGPALRDVVPINGCPRDRTGLANDEVKPERCERCGTVEAPRGGRESVVREATTPPEQVAEVTDGESVVRAEIVPDRMLDLVVK